MIARLKPPVPQQPTLLMSHNHSEISWLVNQWSHSLWTADRGAEVIYLPSDPKPQGYNGWRYLAINHDACGCGRAEGIDRYGNKVYDDWLCESHQACDGHPEGAEQ
jgi:hypothetical protein